MGTSTLKSNQVPARGPEGRGVGGNRVPSLVPPEEGRVGGKRVLITGITGFVGSHVARRLTTLGAEVFGISRSVSGENVLCASILESEAVRNFMKLHGIEVCIHLAGETTVEDGQRDPARTFSVNVQGTVSILECARAVPLERVIVASTSQVYGAHASPCDETSALRASRPYEVSKACADLISQSYAASFDLPILIPRFVNTYGPGDTHVQRLIPRTMRGVLLGQPPTMWGGNVKREYLYIDDAVEAFLRLLYVPWARVGSAKVFNIGTEQPVSVEEVIRNILEISGAPLPIRRVADERRDEIPLQSVSTARARDILDWAPRVSLDEGLQATLQWYALSLGSTVSAASPHRSERILPAA